MKKSLLFSILCFGLISADEPIQPTNNRIERRNLAFKNISDYWITIITLDNRRITLRPHDYEWNGFSIGWEPVDIVAQLAPGVYIHDVFSREYDDETRWIIQVFKQVKKIVLKRQRESDKGFLTENVYEKEE